MMFLSSLSTWGQGSNVISSMTNAAAAAMAETDSAVTNVLAEADTIVSTVDTSSLYRTIYNDAKAGLKGLASALSVGVEHVYIVLVKQQVVKAIQWIILGLIPMILFIVFGKPIWRWAAKNAQESDGFSIFLAGIFFVTTFISMIVGIFHIDVIITGFVNPEYGAMEQIMEWAKAGISSGCSTCGE